MHVDTKRTMVYRRRARRATRRVRRAPRRTAGLRRRMPFRRYRRRPGPTRSLTTHRFLRFGASTQNLDLGQLGHPTENPSGVKLFALRWALDQVANFSEFTQLYDKYRLEKVYLKLTWLPEVFAQPYTMEHLPDSETVGRTGVMATTTPTLRVFMLNDHDGDLDSYSESRIRQRRDVTVRTLNPNFKSSVRWSVRPTINMAAFTNDTAATATVRTQGRSTWLDCTQPGTNHFGTILMFDAMYNNMYKYGRVSLEARYLVSFRNPQ